MCERLDPHYSERFLKFSTTSTIPSFLGRQLGQKTEFSMPEERIIQIRRPELPRVGDQNQAAKQARIRRPSRPELDGQVGQSGRQKARIRRPSRPERAPEGDRDRRGGRGRRCRGRLRSSRSQPLRKIKIENKEKKNLTKLAQLGRTENRGELCKNPKTGIQEFEKKTMIWVIGNVIRKAYTKFQDASSIANTPKSKGTVQ